jgi:hypothetical protein
MTEGKVEFKASKKVLTSAGGGSGAVTLREQSELKDCEWKT